MVGGSFARSWERSAETVEKQASGQAMAYGYETSTPEELHDSGEEPYFAGVVTIENTQYCYDYNVPGINAIGPERGFRHPRLRVPAGQAGPEVLHVGGVVRRGGQGRPQPLRRLLDPAGRKPGGGQDAETARGNAVVYVWQRHAYRRCESRGGRQHRRRVRRRVGHGTNSEYQPWWQVDMGGIQWIDAIQIWNRTDADVAGRTKDYYVLTTTTDFAKELQCGPCKPSTNCSPMHCLASLRSGGSRNAYDDHGAAVCPDGARAVGGHGRG